MTQNNTAQKKRKLSEASADFLNDGFTGDRIFIEKQNCQAYTFDDIIIMPGHINSEHLDVQLETRVSRNIKLNLPILSSPMDTVTEHQMAIAMALQGALGRSNMNSRILAFSNYYFDFYSMEQVLSIIT